MKKKSKIVHAKIKYKRRIGYEENIFYSVIIVKRIIFCVLTCTTHFSLEVELNILNERKRKKKAKNKKK
jgi:hypothetical protein